MVEVERRATGQEEIHVTLVDLQVEAEAAAAVRKLAQVIEGRRHAKSERHPPTASAWQTVRKRKRKRKQQQQQPKPQQQQQQHSSSTVAEVARWGGTVLRCGVTSFFSTSNFIGAETLAISALVLD